MWREVHSKNSLCIWWARGGREGAGLGQGPLPQGRPRGLNRNRRKPKPNLPRVCAGAGLHSDHCSGRTRLGAWPGRVWGSGGAGLGEGVDGPVAREAV